MTNFNPALNRTTSESSRRGSWWSKLIAIVAIINFVLVLFDLSYIPWRDLYLREFPSIVTFYDPLKGIEPHRVTQKYLSTVDELAQQLHQVEPQTTQVELLLEDLRNQSVVMINENPFMEASKVGTFAKIKHRMRQRFNTESAKEAFKRFWSSDYLVSNGVDETLSFFDEHIKPLIQRNYFRNVDDNGQFVDKFWQVDIFFIGLFAIDYLIGTFLFSLRQPEINWLEAMLRRWYDIFLLLPFWRWLRVLPIMVRLHQAGLLNLERVIAHLTYQPVAYLADKVSKFIVVRSINQAQVAIEEGEVSRFLLKQRKYITINNINEQAVITERLLQVIIQKVLPQVQPNMEALLHHSIETGFKQSNFYQSFQKLPIIGNMPVEATEQLANNLAEVVVNALTSFYADKKGREIIYRLTQDFNTALRRELKDDKTLSELELLFSDLLEELKLNYVQHSTAIDPQETLAEVEQLYQTGKPFSV